MPGKRQLCIDLAVATGIIEERRVAAAVDRIDHVCAILFKLVRTDRAAA